MPDQKSGWGREFEEPIPLPDGRRLVTLQDAGEYIQSLPKATQNTAPWRNATEALLVVVNQNGPTMFARIAMMQALYPAGERVFNPDRKETHWGKRKLKRDR
ncbi:hypothetical protein [Bradyrhizobium sp. Ash2021]|uniref:hypothetical protein n=1 Tax=Bradyrhizobium sp. Ash2021 TaxID=2954771 RepID=UPI00281670D7|nr:hypothetical protein [Bradyrhizobium sp. Ash2021]WMT71083.1 hypothetical protein NL528_23550 [Bradyrhizobium sp. Ash2021]